MQVIIVASELLVAVAILIVTVVVWVVLGFQYAITKEVVVLPTIFAVAFIAYLVYDAIRALKDLR